MLDLAFQKAHLVQWSRSCEQDSPKITPSPWGLHCPLRVKVARWTTISTLLSLCCILRFIKLQHTCILQDTTIKGSKTMRPTRLGEAYHIERALAARQGITRYPCGCERCHGFKTWSVQTVETHHRKYGRDTKLQEPLLVSFTLLCHWITPYTYIYMRCFVVICSFCILYSIVNNIEVTKSSKQPSIIY